MSIADYDYLIDIESPEALTWAKERSGRALHFVDTELADNILAYLDDDTKIAYSVRRGDFFYNFWTDGNHPKGLWRRASADSYLAKNPQWQVLLDLDALAATENENWVWRGTQMFRNPDGTYDRALVKLSRGGADATVVREFDIDSLSFIADGFFLPEAKSQVGWVDRDTLLVGTDRGEGTVTTSGYPSTSVLWRRGEDIADAELFFAGSVEDMAVTAWYDDEPGYERTFALRTLDFYRSHLFVETAAGLQIIETPEDAQAFVFRQWLFVLPREDFSGIPGGGLGVIDFDAFLTEARRDFTVLFSPVPGESSLQSLDMTDTHLVVTTLVNVASHIVTIPLGEWDTTPVLVPLPEASTARVSSTSRYHSEIWVGANSFTRPDTVYRYEVGGQLEEFATAPVGFDATGMETRQHFATSADGTKIPYFIVGNFDAVTQPAPTLVYAYGGFEVSLVPSYSMARGAGWLTRGGFYVQPALRGGGEFGPEWHKQATVLSRHKCFEDHQAVLRDVVARGYTTPEQLSIRGGSNGGLLTAVALTRYPEDFGAAVIQVPLADMLRYHTWLAGASWLAEYGSPDKPDERAYLEGYSPAHNVAPASKRPYPPALVTTSTRDDRVHPAHARILTALLEENSQPVVYYENAEGGHAGASDNPQVARTESLVYTWLWQQMPS